MEVVEESYCLHSRSWKEYDKTKVHLNNALELLSEAYEGGDTSNVVVNNLAAVLLDLFRDTEALALLKRHQPECSQYCQNYAIALAKQEISDTKRNTKVESVCI